ncbi:DUF805 domain-containing protein [Butyrivibrio proteoclasticus]|uniref:DUF805 domain-containing protein n=1 Tax=Butyrivibrio proteoclasticus TaxID=43305 RepID=UPI00047CBC84|nr:DUF805 domain-containing protein [Butyrivibrio proteoclasticus]
MSFTDAVKSVFSQYAGFSGRARRSEYWYFYLFNFCVALVLSILANVVKPLGFLSMIWSLAVLIPGLAVGVRRLHDIGKSGLFLLFALIPLVGAILLIIWFATDSQPGDNQYGPNPKGVAGFGAGQPTM